MYGPANHDGGALAIGPDGKLYIGVGDTGCNSRRFVDSDSPPANYYSTCLTNGNGKILRVNLDGTIPSDNPLVGRTVTACGAGCADIPSGSGAAREDIWAWGFRNPWRFWFDPQNGNLWVGDVGELSYEEINIIPQSKKGKHYGWPWREGRKGHPRGACETATAGAGECEEPAYVCRQSGFADPATPDLCRSITGGVIVDSCDWPAAFRGRYYFGDNALVPAPVWSVAVNRERSAVVQDSRRELLQASSPVIHFEAGKDNALYYAVHGGRIGRITPKSPGVCPDGGAGSGGSAGSSGAAGGAGSPGSGGVGGADAGPGQAGSSGSGNDDGSGDDGCGCSVPGASAPKLAGLGIAASALLLWSRLRRSGSSLKKGRGGRPMV